MERGPIFIGGPDRCGKTLLRALLVSHPHIAIPDVGSNYWTYFYGQYGDLSHGDNFERCLRAMLHYKHALFVKPDAERIRREFWQGEASYARLFALLHQHYAERQGKPRWGDQTGLIERYADPLFAAYPDAVLIHMIRDPRDRYGASLEKWPTGRMRVGGATARWLYSVGWAQRNQRRYPDRYKIVRYETLVQQPETTLRDICAFIGETFMPSMLTMEAAPIYRDKGAHRSPTDGATNVISTTYIGRYHNVVPTRELAFMQAHARRAMQTFGYDLDPIQWTLKERLAYGLRDWPANLVRMRTWQAIETLQHNFPAYVGRKPDPNMIVKDGASRSKTSPKGVAS